MASSSDMALHLLAQSESRAVKAGFHGAIWQTGDLGDLFDRKILDIAEHHDRPVIIIEAADRFLEQLGLP